MTEPAFSPPTPNRAVLLKKMEELRRRIPRMEGLRKIFPFGLAALDSHLPEGGLASGTLHEIVPQVQTVMPAALGFIAATLGRISSSPPCREESWVRGGRLYTLIDVRTSPSDPSPCPSPQEGRKQRAFLPPSRPLLFVMPTYGLRACGRLHGHGLRALGLDPARLILVETTHRRDTLWAIEETLRSGAPAAVVGVVDKLDFKTSQRLHLAATDAGLPLLLIRPAHNLESSAATTRWHVNTAEAARDRFGLITRPRWHLRLERCRNGRPGEWVVEYDHVAHRFSLAAALADSALSRSASEAVDGKSRRA